MTKLTTAVVWLSFTTLTWHHHAVAAFLHSPTTSFVQDTYGKAAVYQQAADPVRPNTSSKNSVVRFLSDIYGLATTPYNQKNEASGLIQDGSGTRQPMMSDQMQDPQGIVMSTEEYHVASLFEHPLLRKYARDAKKRKTYVLPTDDGKNPPFDLNLQRILITSQFLPPSPAPSAPPAHKISMILPEDHDGDYVVFDMNKHLKNIQAQFRQPPPATATAPPPTQPQVVAPEAVAQQQQAVDPHQADLQELEENAKLMEQQKLTINDESTTAVPH